MFPDWKEKSTDTRTHTYSHSSCSPAQLIQSKHTFAVEQSQPCSACRAVPYTWELLGKTSLLIWSGSWQEITKILSGHMLVMSLDGYAWNYNELHCRASWSVAVIWGFCIIHHVQSRIFYFWPKSESTEASSKLISKWWVSILSEAFWWLFSS